MIRKSETAKKIKNMTSKQRRWFRKLEIKKLNENPEVRFTLDPNKYEWKKSCKKCHGRGILGTTLKTNKQEKRAVLCYCVRLKKKEKENTEDKEVEPVDKKKKYFLKRLLDKLIALIKKIKN